MTKKVVNQIMDMIGSENMSSFAVVRADDMDKVRVALCDLIRYAHLTFDGKVRKLEPAFADNILVHVMQSQLKTRCEAACIVSVNEEASAAIGKLRKIHPPAHIIIVSQRHDIYYDLANYVNLLPAVEMNIEQNMQGYLYARGAEKARSS